MIDKAAWQRVRETEISRGAEVGKIKEKIVDRQEMFSVASEQ